MRFLPHFIGFWPDCYAPRTCAQEGKRGDYPNCRAIEVVRTCLPHQTGVYPQCTWLPCPEAFLSKSGDSSIFLCEKTHFFCFINNLHINSAYDSFDDLAKY